MGRMNDLNIINGRRIFYFMDAGRGIDPFTNDFNFFSIVAYTIYPGFLSF